MNLTLEKFLPILVSPYSEYGLVSDRIDVFELVVSEFYT